MKHLAYIMPLVVLLMAAVTIGHAETGDNPGDMRIDLLGPGDADMVTSISIFDAGDVVYAGTDVGGIYKSADHGRTWVHRNCGLRNYDVSTPVLRDPFRKDLHYVGTRGGFYKSVDGGETWKVKWKGMSGPRKFTLSAPIGAVTADMMKPGVLYMGLGCRPDNDRVLKQAKDSLDGAFYRSEDHGESWEAISNIGEGACIRHILQHPKKPDVLFVCSDRGILRSRDSGKNWDRVLEGDARYILFRESDDALFAAMATEGVAHSRNNGDTWVWLNTGLPLGQKNNYSTITGFHGSDDVLYLLNSTWNPEGGMYSYTPTGKKWVRMIPDYGKSNLPETWLRPSKRVNAIALHKSEIFIGTSRSIYLSADNGKTWNQLISKKRSDGGWSHMGLNVFGQTRSFAIDPKDPQNMLLGTTDHGLVKSSNGGKSWIAVDTGIADHNDIWDIVFSNQAPHTAYAIALKLHSSSAVLRSDNSGLTWEPIDDGAFIGKRLSTLLCSNRNRDSLIVAGDSGVYETRNGGNTWQEINRGLPECSVNCLSYYTGDDGMILAGTDKGLFKKEKDGPWQLITPSEMAYVSSIFIDRENSNRIYAGTRLTRRSEGGVYMSDDCGVTWKKVLSKLRWVSSVVRLSHTLYVSTNDDNSHDESSGDGIYRSPDSGRSWERVSWNLPVMRFYKMTVSEGADPALFLCSNGSGLLRVSGLLSSPK